MKRETGNGKRVEKARVEAIHVGTELLTFKFNAHSVYLANALRPLGLSLARAELVNDDLEELTRSIREALHRAEIVFVTGGLGPTFDDLTREAASAALGVPLKRDMAVLPKIEARFAAIKMAMPESNLKQAEILEGASVLFNDVGTAPGQLFKTREGKFLLLLPGPPEELDDTLAKAIPDMRKKFSTGPASGVSFHIAGLPESRAEEMARPLLKVLNPETVTATILAAPHVIDFIFTIHGSSRGALADKIRREIKKIFGADYFGEGEATLESALGEALKARKETVSVAESCTGGLVGHRLTNIAGSSAYFLQGITAYDNGVKTRALSVSERTLVSHGAVSAETAKEMALGMLKKSGSDWAVSVTGICGPSGGTEAKPVGLVYFGVAGKNGILKTEKRQWAYPKGRTALKDRMASFAMDFLRRELL